MIAYIQGKLMQPTPTQVSIDVGGLGYDVQISLHTYDQIKDLNACKLFTYLHITADAHVLYGFADNFEKQWFLHLQQVNGIGPRAAITILSSLTPIELQQAITQHDAATLQAVKGIGQKVAQRIILELSGKANQPTTIEKAAMGHLVQKEALKQEALTALIKLGIHKTSAEKAILQIMKDHTKELNLETLIKLALKS